MLPCYPSLSYPIPPIPSLLMRARARVLWAAPTRTHGCPLCQPFRGPRRRRQRADERRHGHPQGVGAALDRRVLGGRHLDKYRLCHRAYPGLTCFRLWREATAVEVEGGNHG